MATIRLFHETDVPRLTLLEPRVPQIDQNALGRASKVTTFGAVDDPTPAVWLSSAQGPKPYTTPRKLYRYAVDVDESDPKLMPYSFVPGWYRYLSSVRPAVFYVLDATRDQYVERLDLVSEWEIEWGEVERLRQAYASTVNSALHEPGVEEKATLHAAAVSLKQQLTAAARREADAYERLAVWNLAAPQLDTL